VRFIDSGRNVMVFGGAKTSEVMQELAIECGAEFDADNSAIVDHVNVDASDVHGDHTKVLTDQWNPATIAALGGAPSAPILYRGVGVGVNPKSPYLHHFLSASPTAYSGEPNKAVQAYPHSTGSETILVVGVQTQSNARVVFSGSMDMFSDEFLTARVSAAGSNDKPALAGNAQFCEGVAAWFVHDAGELRVRDVQHHSPSHPQLSPNSYRIGDDMVFSIVVEEYDGASGGWKTFNANDIQLQLIMLDPYIRITLDQGEDGRYHKQFRVPDTFGVYKLRIDYTREGYSVVDFEQTLSIRPYRHDEYPRFLYFAYPYYLSVFSLMGSVFVMGIVFLYHKDKPKSE
jgi:dolichyl-diphosphooligosaccharide---protein glycosyltransferase subunit DDOST/WBP1